MNFSLPRFSLKHPITVLMFLVSVVGFGVIACYRMPIKFLPEMDFPFIRCFIQYPGATPEQVEREIAIPAEGEFRTIPGMKQISTFSNSDGCAINMRFENGINMSTASSEVRDRMERLKPQLPKDVDKMLLMRHNTTSLPVMALGIFRSGSDSEFIHLVRNVVKPRISRVPGVADVTVFASKPEPEVLIQFDQNKLRQNNIALYQVLTALQTANLNLSVGDLVDGNRRFYVRVKGEMDRPEELADLAISPLGLKLRDVADVGFRTRDMEAHFDIDGKGGAFMLVMKESEANTVDTCRGIQRELETIKADPAFAGTGTLIFFNQADLIEFALDGLIKEGQGGAVMSIIVLFAFLLRFRPTFVCTLAIPTSIVAALGFMYFVGMTLNVVTMVSLIVAVGMLVDDAIVVIENIYRYHQLGMPLREASERGASEVAVAVTASTLTILVVFVPVLYMGTGEMAQHMKQFAVPMSASLMASLFVAFTLIPLATAHMKDVAWIEGVRARAAARAEAPDSSLFTKIFRVHPFTWLSHMYGWALDKVITHRFFSAVAIMMLLGLTYIPYQLVGMQDMPTLDMHEVDVDIDFDQDFDLKMADATFERVKASIEPQREELGIKNMFTHYDANQGTCTIYLKRDEDYPEGVKPPYKTKQVRAILSERLPDMVPGCQVKVNMPEGNEGGGRAGIVSVRLGGDDSATLKRLADEVAAKMREVKNVVEVKVVQEREKDEIQIAIDEPLAANAGISPMLVARTVDVALRGNQLWPMKQGGREFPVWAQFREEDRKSRANLDNVTVAGMTGALVPLNQLVDYSRASSPTTIQRVDGRNVMLITARATTEVLSDVQMEMAKLIENFPTPPGYTVSLGNEFDDLRDNMANFFVTIIFAVLLVYIVMAALFESLLLPLSILVSVPLAFVGVYWGMFILRTPLDTIGIIGCVLMVGVVVRNGIVIIDHINLLRKEGLPRHQAIVQAGKDRFRPVVMTALTTILGVLPLAFEASAGSTVSFVSLGRAFICGLTTGTILTLVIVPLFYTIFEDIRDAAGSFFTFLRVLSKDDVATPEAQPEEV